MTRKEERNDLIDCFTIDANVIITQSDGEIYKSKCVFYVPYQMADEYKKFIEATIEFSKLPCSRVYYSGAATISKNQVSTKRKIVEKVEFEKNLINKILVKKQEIELNNKKQML